MFSLLTLNIFHIFCNIFIVDFEQTNVSWAYTYKKINDQLSRPKDTCILRQNKERGVMLLDGTKYPNKCLELLQTNQFIKLNHHLQNHIYNESTIPEKV